MTERAFVRNAKTWFGKNYHVHNAEMVQAEDWGTKQTRLRFKGVSCGHGYRANEATIFIDKGALKKMIGIVQLGEARMKRRGE